MSDLLFDLDFENMEYKKNNHSLVVADGLYEIGFNKTHNDFSDDLNRLVRYVSRIESLVRTSNRYKKYKEYLFNEIKLDRCTVLGNITKDDADIEMHHGPIYNLFDISFIVLNHKLTICDDNITTFSIAKEILDLHYKNYLQIVMLATSVHEQEHDNQGFISLNQAWGNQNILKFLEKYKYGLTIEHKDKFMKYLKLSKYNDSNYGDMFTIGENITRWADENNIELYY